MNKRTESADIYFRFLKLAEALRGLPSLPSLEPLEERILELVAKAGNDKVRLSVRDVMAHDYLGSPGTVHSRLKSLRAKGWIVLSDTEDARRKQVELSMAAHAYFSRLSRCIVDAAQKL
jgi:DNA-binding MarR family transcriptional regulator